MFSVTEAVTQEVLVGKAVLGSFSTCTFNKKKKEEEKKKEKELSKCLSNIPESWELGSTGANYREQGTEWSAYGMCLVLLKVAVQPNEEISALALPAARVNGTRFCFFPPLLGGNAAGSLCCAQ